MPKPAAVRRSACDQCRAKRVRCLRAQDSMAPCARCCYIGARCVTGTSGQPGRPPKHRLADDGDGTTPRGTTAVSLADVSSPGPHCTSSTLRDVDHVEVHPPAMAEMPSPPPARASQCRANKDPLVHEPQQDFWVAPGGSSAFFGCPSIDQSPAPGEDIPSLTDQLSNPSPSQFQGLLSTDDELNAMLHLGVGSSTAFDMDIDPLLGHGDGILPTPLSQFLSTASSLVGFREEIDQRIPAIDAYYSDSAKVVQRCKDEGAGRDENPVAVLLTCSKEFIDIIQGLAPEDALSTEIVLLALSSYLALMRLFDSLFHRIYKYLCKVPPESYESIKVKSVLRIGGISSLQDMPLRAYAIGILDAIQSQVQIIERRMGLPAEYCLSGEAAASPTPAAAPGIFSRADRARLFRAAVAQEDVKSQRGSKSYVESIRASIKDSMAFLHD
ncbi:hypothetical protein FQN50_001921 [Emmonsiellopsis sp. PD_5]|nr:hypothetical protein FQN50_001921 [Emmonsiellopsis sp. PD_5]